MPGIGIAICEWVRPQPLDREVEYLRIKEDSKTVEIVYVTMRILLNGLARDCAYALAFPKTGPGWARSLVSQIAIPSPKRCEDSPVICKEICEQVGCWLGEIRRRTLNSTSTTKFVAVRGRRDHSHPFKEQNITISLPGLLLW